MPGFRQFANDINKSANTGAAMPTYDNFKKDFKGGKSGSKPRKVQQEDSSGFGGGFDRLPALKNQSEILHWEKYFFELNAKVKEQRESIKKYDERLERIRNKNFEQEVEMRIMSKVQ